MPNELSVQEQIELSHLEERIERGKQACLEMARALQEIHDRKLYRAESITFEEYCETRWGLGDRHVRNLISYASTIDNLETGTTVPLLPTNERQSRPMQGMEPEQQTETWEAAVSIAPGGKPTSAHVQRAADAVKAKPQVHVGQETTVLDENSPLYGQPVKVSRAEGVIIHCETLDGNPIAQPFLVNELASDTAPAADKTWKPSAKIDRTEALEAALDVERKRVEDLEHALRQIIEAARSGKLTDDLLDEAEEML